MKLWIAQGFGAGWIPIAPGTAGSVVGLGWFFLLLLTHSWAWFIAGNVAAFVLSVWLCGEGEKALQRKDPGSVVLDEIVAMPCCFIVWMISAPLPFSSPDHNHRLGPSFFWQHAVATMIIFGLFRLFDTWKPWPVRQSQILPGGWGVTVDDYLAAVYVNAMMCIGLIVFG